MAVKEFSFGPQNYFESDYTSGDYTAPGIVRTFLQCDIDRVFGGVVLTGEYYEGEYIDGTYFHDNSIKTTLSCEFTKVKSFEIGITNYFEEDYFEDSGYAQTKGSEFSLTAQAGILLTAQATFEPLFNFGLTADAIKNSFAILDSSFIPTIDANANFVANAITLNSIINQSLMGNRVRLSSATVNASVNLSLPTQTIFRTTDANLTSSFSAGTSNLPTTDTIITADAGSTLSSTFSMSATGTVPKFASANLSSSFTQTATGIKYQLRDRSGVDIYEHYHSSNQGPISTTVKFGTGALLYDTEDNQNPWNTGFLYATPIFYDGSDYVFLADDKFWSSSDLTNWTETTTDLNTATSDEPLWAYKSGPMRKEADSNGNSLYVVNMFQKSSNNNNFYSFSSSNKTNWTKTGAGLQFPGSTQKNFLSISQTTGGAGIDNIFSIYRGTTFGGTTYLVQNFSGDTASGKFCGPWAHYSDTTNNDVYVAINMDNEIWIFKGTSFLSWSNTAQLSYDSSHTVKDYLHDGTYHYIITEKNILRSSNGTSWTEIYAPSEDIIGAAIDTSGNWFIKLRNNLTNYFYGSNLTSLTTVSEGLRLPIANDDSRGNTIIHDGTNFVYMSNTSDVAGNTFDGSSLTPFQTPLNFPKLSLSVDSGSLSNFKTMDFWFRKTGNNNQTAILRGLSNTSNPDFSLITQNPDPISQQSRFTLSYYDTNGGYNSSNLLTTSASWTSNYVHFRIVQDSSRLSLYVDGTRLYTNTKIIDTTITDINLGHYSTISDQGLIDEFYLSDYAENDPTDTTITVPTTPWLPDENTKVLLHFDGDTTADTSLVFDIDETLSAQASLTLTATNTIDANAIHLGTFSSTADANFTVGVDANLNNNFSLSAEGIKVVTMLDATLSTNATATTSIDKLVSAESTVSSTATLTGSVQRNRFGETNFSSIATSINVINKIGNTLVDFPNSEFTVTTNADKFFGIIATLESNATLSADVLHIKDFNLNDLQTTATLTADVNYRPEVFMDNQGTGTLDADVNVIRDIDEVLLASFDVDPFIDGIRDFVSNLDVEFTQQSTAIKTVVVSSNIDSVATQNATATKSVIAGSTISTISTMNVTATKIVEVDTEFESLATYTSAVAKIGDFLINLESAFSTVTEATKSTGNVVNLETFTSMTTQPLHIKNVEIDEAQAAFTQTTNGRKDTDVVSTFDIEASLTSDVEKVVVANATLNGAIVFGISVRVLKNNEIDLFEDFALTATANVERDATATPTAVATATIEATKLLNVDATLTSNTTLTATAKVFVIDAIEYKILKETREFSIASETREYQVQFEQRETKVTI